MDFSILHIINGNGNLFLDGLAKTLTFGWTWLPLYITFLILVIKNNKTMGQVCLICCCGLLGVALAGGVSDVIVKPLTERVRPCDDPAIMYTLHLVDGVHVSGYSFFSSHAANTFSLAMFFCLLVRNKTFSITLFLWALLNSWTRIYLAVHYPSDVAVGIVWGLFVGLLMYLLYYKIFYKMGPKTKYVSTHYTSTGYEITDIDICLSVILLTLIYAVLRALIV